jgi:hypothetical protein
VLTLGSRKRRPRREGDVDGDRASEGSGVTKDGKGRGGEAGSDRVTGDGEDEG